MTALRRSPVLLLAGVALALRLAWVGYRWWLDGPTLTYDDEALHWQLARNLVRHGTMVSDDGRYVARMPVYPLFLACFAWLGPIGVLVVRLVQCVCGAAAVWIGGRLATRVWGRRAGIAAAALVAFDPFGVFFANLLLTEVPFTLVAVGLIAASWHLLPTRGSPAAPSVRAPDVAPAADTGVAIGPAALVGLLGAAAIMTRPSAAGWIVLLWAVIWMLDRDRRRATIHVLVFVAALAVPMAAWGLRNVAVVGDPAWLSANGGLTLYDAQGPQADGSSDQSFLNRMPELDGLGEVERDRVLRQRAVEQMRAEPGRVLELARVKFLRTWSLTPNVAEHSRGATAVASAVFTVVVLLGAFAGLLRSLRRRDPAAMRLQLLVWLPVVYFTLLHCVFIGSVRYRVPLMPMLAIAAAGAIAAHVPRNTAPDETAGRPG